MGLLKEIIETIFEKANSILETVGVEFKMDSAVELFKKSVAKISANAM